MSYTRKDFDNTARVIRAQVDSAEHLPESGPAVIMAAGAIARGMADLYGSVNPGFDRARFMKACGFTAHETDTEIIELRLTDDNVTTQLRPGDVFTDDDELAPVKSVRLSHDGQRDARITFMDGVTDILGLPQTVRITRKKM